MKIGNAAAMLFATCLCAACQYSPDMLDRTLAYNRTVADSTNQVLLLNIIRASERLPTYYTRLEGDASSMSLTPNGSLSLPLTNPRSFENDINGGPTGAVTGTTSKAIGSLASIATSLGLQASESNLLTLQTLDDQKYQNGMMTPVPVKNIQAFQDEGYQRDLLFMMYLSSIQISGRLVGAIDDGVTERCSALRARPGDGISGGSFIHQLCAYIDSRPYQSLFDAQGVKPAAYSFSLKTCADTGGAISDAAPKDMVHFNNDPAREGRMQAPGDPHPEVCFQILLDDLLILGLEVGSSQDIPAELVDVVPDAVAQNPQFRAQMIQQNFFFRETSAGVSAICKKKSADNGFTLTLPNPPRQTIAAPLTNLLDLLGASGAIPPRAPSPPAAQTAPAAKDAAAPSANAAYPANPVTACQQKNPGVPESAADEVLASPTDADTNPNARSNALKTVKLTSDKVAFSTRSFQGMIYYLGEAMRYEDDASANPVSFPRVLGRNPAVVGSGYFEILFYGSSHVPDGDVAVSVHDDGGKGYAIPKTCMSQPFNQAARMAGCSAEYPDNESLDVLNFVNQVWGLQKESVTSPTSPLVVVNPQ